LNGVDQAPSLIFIDEIDTEFQSENFLAMKFTARMLYYCSSKSCCVVNFIARKFQIEPLLL